MSCPEAEKLTEDFHSLVDDLCDAVESELRRAIRAWLKAISPECSPHANRLVAIYRTRDRILIHTGGFYVGNDHSQNINTGGGAITGSAIGASSTVTAEVIQSLQNSVQQSGSIDQKGADLLREASQGIGQIEDSDLQGEAIKELTALIEELKKPAPKVGLVKKFWGGLSSVASTIPAVVKLGEWLVAKFPAIVAAL